MQGAYDLHMHAAPSPFHRVLDDYGLLEEAGRAGMAGIMLKSHYESTIARAILANIHCASCTKAYGGLVLNWPVGGLNPYAVENAMKRGCRIVWMPTRDAKNSLCSGNMPGDFFDRSGISILTETGELRAEVLEILRIARKYDAAVATGHISVFLFQFALPNTDNCPTSFLKQFSNFKVVLDVTLSFFFANILDYRMGEYFGNRAHAKGNRQRIQQSYV